MEHTLLQSFAINNQQQLVSVREVERGKACECCCPVCGELVIARQGEIRAWHFAHASGADCSGAAEGALHLAAKQLIARHRSLLTPALAVHAAHTLADGRTGSAALVLPESRWELDEVRLEAPLGTIRPDVLATHAAAPVIIEIAVTHPADEDKIAAIAELGMAAIEIALDPAMVAEWTWEALRQEVLARPANRRWLFHPQHRALREQSAQQAICAAYAKQDADARQVDRSARVSSTRLRLFTVPIHLNEYAWGLCLWSAYHEQTNRILKQVARRFGGRWSRKYANWRFPAGVKEVLLTELQSLGARLE